MSIPQKFAIEILFFIRAKLKETAHIELSIRPNCYWDFVRARPDLDYNFDIYRRAFLAIIINEQGIDIKLPDFRYLVAEA